MPWTHWICATRSGEKVAQVEPVSGSFERKLNGVGTGSHDFVTKEFGAGATADDRRASRQDLTRPWDRTLVQCWNNQPIYAGLITGKSDNGKGITTINTAELREVFKYRTTFGRNGYNGDTGGFFDLKNQTLASIAGWLIWDVEQGLTSAWDLPLVLPPRDMAGTQTRAYQEYNLPVIETELAAIQNTEGGPDVDFVPSWTAANTLQWTGRVGNLSGDTLEWNLGVAEPGLTGFSFVEDGNKQGNVFYAVGNGSDRDLKVATSSTLMQGDEVALERVVRYSQERNTGVLQAHANEDLRAYRRPTRQYSFSMQADGEPEIRRLSLGQTLRTWTQGHDWLNNGWLSHRLVGFSGDLTNTVKLQLQEQ